MSRRHIIFSELDFQPRSWSKQGELKVPVSFEEQLLLHKCRIYDAPSLLFEKRWTGTESVTIHLYTSSIERSKTTAALFKSKSSGIFTASFAATPHTLRVSDIELVDAKARVDPEPLLSLADFCLYLEPNKVEMLPPEMRYVVNTDPANFELLLLRDVTICARNQKALLKTLRRISQKGKAMKVNEKGKDAFEKLERRRTFLIDVIKNQIPLITHIYTCRVCDCILLILGRPRSSAAAALAGSTVPLQARQMELEAKLQQATGSDNKQKRKKLKRKIRALQSALEGTDALPLGGPAQSAAPATATSAAASGATSAPDSPQTPSAPATVASSEDREAISQ